MPNQIDPSDAVNAPLSSSFTPSSWSSTLGVAEALASYRRSQYIIAGQNVASSVDTDEQRDDIDEESQLEAIDDEESEVPEHEEDPFLDDFEQDDNWRAPKDSLASPSQAIEAPVLSRQTTSTIRPSQSPEDKTPVLRSPLLTGLSPSGQDERTPLLRQVPSSTSVLQLPRRRRDDNIGNAQPSPPELQPVHRPSQGSLVPKIRLQRKHSTLSSRSVKIHKGTSTFGQTVRSCLLIKPCAYMLMLSLVNDSSSTQLQSYLDLECLLSPWRSLMLVGPEEHFSLSSMD